MRPDRRLLEEERDHPGQHGPHPGTRIRALDAEGGPDEHGGNRGKRHRDELEDIKLLLLFIRQL